MTGGDAQFWSVPDSSTIGTSADYVNKAKVPQAGSKFRVRGRTSLPSNINLAAAADSPRHRTSSSGVRTQFSCGWSGCRQRRLNQYSA